MPHMATACLFPMALYVNVVSTGLSVVTIYVNIAVATISPFARHPNSATVRHRWSVIIRIGRAHSHITIAAA
ncbi:hypothetical protein GCM10023149_40340 [Mucilaginibacter gynuensis]|uniref:Secreted protein n=1 Tax=Mucilaginibacter gynuensis TaxID=1302236 RepID=A0ABP8H3E1_9SPHI